MENHKFVLDKLDDTTYKLQQLLFEFTNLMVYSQNEELRKRVGWETIPKTISSNPITAFYNL